MNKIKLQKLVTTTVALHREIAEKTEQLKLLKATLVEEARLHPSDHIANDKGGSRWTAEGADGCIARVSFPAPTLISELDAKSDLTEQCQAIAGESFRKLFIPVKFYQLADDFRAEVKALLPEAKAEELTKLCENEASPRVSFETAKEKIATKGTSSKARSGCSSKAARIMMTFSFSASPGSKHKGSARALHAASASTVCRANQSSASGSKPSPPKPRAHSLRRQV